MKQLFDGTRRRFLGKSLGLGIAAAACTSAAPAFAALPRLGSVRNLAFHNLHTDEKLQTTYWKDGSYDRGAMEKISHILRDHYSGETHPMNAQLMDLLFDLQRKVNNDKPVEIISGYRSPRTNMMLASATDGVAKRSYHMQGMAMDIRMTGTGLPTIHNAALVLRRGGVGYYPDSQFVHIDVGPIRTW